MYHKVNYKPCKKCNGYSGNFFTIRPLNNLLPKCSVFINAAYFAIPISYGENSNQSKHKLKNLLKNSVH